MDLRRSILLIFGLVIGQLLHAQANLFTTEKPIKDLVVKHLETFQWDDQNRAHKNEAFRLLTFLGADYEHYQEYETGEGYVCGKLPSGTYLTVFTDSYGNTNQYHIRFGEGSNHEYFATPGFQDETTYAIDKVTNPDYKPEFVFMNDKKFKEDKSMGILFGPSYALKYMLENPPKLLSVETRTDLLARVVWDVIPSSGSGFESPIMLSEDLSNGINSFKKGDMIIATLDKGKLDRITIDNANRKLGKLMESIEVFIFRQGQFLKKTFEPNIAFSYYDEKAFQKAVWDLRYNLTDYILESGPIDWQLDKNVIIGSTYSGSPHPLIGVICSPYRYSARVLDLMVANGADINIKDHFNNTPLHVAAGRYYHSGCTYYDHKKVNDKSGAYGYRGSEEAYFHLISLGAKDDVENKTNTKLNYHTPKEYYFLTFKNEEHKVRPKDFDWNALANAVVAGAGAALDEKQRQINKTNAINAQNQAYDVEVQQRIQAQKNSVAKSNEEYLNRVNKVKPEQNTINSTGKETTSKVSSQLEVPEKLDTKASPGSNYTNEIRLNAGTTDTSKVAPVKTFITYNIGQGYYPGAQLPEIGSTGGYSNISYEIIGFREKYIPRLKSGGDYKNPNDWEVEIWKHEVQKTTIQTYEPSTYENQIKTNKLVFATSKEAFESKIPDEPNNIVFWSMEAAKEWINSR